MLLDTETMSEPSIEVASPTPDITETVVPEPVVEEIKVDEVVVETPEVKTDEEVKTDAVDDETKVDEVKTNEVVVEPLTFDTSKELPELIEATTKVLDEYDIPQPVQAVIDALRVKAEAANTDPLDNYADVYGGMDEVKTLLDRESLLKGRRVDDNGTRRPNTDKYVEEIAKISTQENDVVGWLHYDLSKQPSNKYPGYTRAQEFLVDGLRHQSDTSPKQVLDRLQKVTQAVMANEMPASDVPAFIPQELHSAFNSLPRETREDIALLADDADYDQSAERGRKLAELSLIKKGLDSDVRENQLVDYKRQQAEQEFNTAVHTKQENFFDTFRNEFTKDLMKDVVFSTDPKMQSLLSHQQVTLLTQAFDDGKVGDYARQALTDAGVAFDVTRAGQLIKGIEDATIAHTIAERAVDENGQVLDRTALNKATRDLETITRQWQEFARAIIDQESRLVATGTAEEVKKQVEKVKIAPKARAAVKAVGTPAIKQEVEPTYKSKEWYDRIAEREMAAQERRARAYA